MTAAASRAAEGAARRGRQPAGRGKRGGGQRRPTGNRRLENVLPCTSESQMQLVVFQGQSESGTTRTSIEPPEPVRGDEGQQAGTPIIEDDEHSDGGTLCSTDTDTCIGIGPMQIRDMLFFQKTRYADAF